MDFERYNANEWNHIPHSRSASQEGLVSPGQRGTKGWNGLSSTHKEPKATVDQSKPTPSANATLKTSALAQRRIQNAHKVAVQQNRHGEQAPVKTYADVATPVVLRSAKRMHETSVEPLRTGAWTHPSREKVDSGRILNTTRSQRFVGHQGQTSGGSSRTQRRVKFDQEPIAVEQERSQEIDAAISTLRQKPDPLIYETLVTGIFPWPVEDIALASLDHEYHRLDHVRLNFGCHIVFDEGTSALKLYGLDIRKVSHAAEAIAQVLCEALTSHMNQTKIIVIDPPADRAFSRVVVRRADDPESPSPAAGLVYGKAGEVAYAVQSSKIMDSAQLYNLSKVEAMTLRTFNLAFADRLGTLRLHKKQMQLRCELGIFLWTSYKWLPTGAPDQPLVKFMANLQDKRTHGSLHALAPQARILERVFEVKTRWRPEQGNVQALDDFKPTYEAWFTFQPDKPGKDDYQLVVTGIEHQGQVSKLLQRSWRLYGTEEQSDVHFKASFARLHRGLSWGIELATAPISITVSEGYREFAQKIRLRKEFRPWSIQNGISLAFDFPPAAKLKKVQQRAIWRFNAQEDRDLSLEIVKNDEYEIVQKSPATSRRLLRTWWETKVDHRRFSAQLADFSKLHTDDSHLLRAKTAEFFPDYRRDTQAESVLQGFIRMMGSIVDELSQVRLI